MGGTTPKGYNGRIGDERRVEKRKIKQNMRVNGKLCLEDKVNRTDPNSPVKKELWLK